MGFEGPITYRFAGIDAETTLFHRDGSCIWSSTENVLHHVGCQSSSVSSPTTSQLTILIPCDLTLTSERIVATYVSLPAVAVNKGVGRNFQGVLFDGGKLKRRDRRVLDDLSTTVLLANIVDLREVQRVTILENSLILKSREERSLHFTFDKAHRPQLSTVGLALSYAAAAQVAGSVETLTETYSNPRQGTRTQDSWQIVK